MSPEDKLKELGLELPPPPAPAANYVTSLRVGNLLFFSGHGPAPSDEVPSTGKVGGELTADQGYLSARQTGLSLLATAKAVLGSLDRVARVVKLLGMVNASPDFRDHPKVINGCSDLFAEVFGKEKGVGTRSAVGMVSLPGQIPTEIEAILEIEA